MEVMVIGSIKPLIFVFKDRFGVTFVDEVEVRVTGLVQKKIYIYF